VNKSATLNFLPFASTSLIRFLENVMSVINTNVNALFAQNALRVNNRKLSGAMEQLSSGTRIASAKDDAAGIAINSTMTAQIRGLGQAVRNANDGVSLLQTAEGAMTEQTNMLQRMRELAIQSSTGTYNTAQQGYLDKEYQALATQIEAITTQTKWNGANVLDATGGDGSGKYTFAVGSTGTETIEVSIASMSTLIAGDVTDSTKATAAITAIDTALGKVNASRAVLGAGMNRWTYAADNLNNVIQNVTASRSQSQDTDYATATTQLARAQIIQQAATAMLAQANQSPQSVLALLK
jgi:flagellin